MGRALLVLLAITACKREFNPEFCLGHPDDVRCGQADAPTACASNAECTDQVCDVPNGVCVDCTPDDTSLCSATAPFCGDDHTCRGCVADDECDGGVCMPDGSCPAESDIIYASTTGSAQSGCGARAMPCSIQQAVAEVTATKKIIKLEPDAAVDYTTTGNNGLLVNKNVTIDVRGARIRKTSGGQAMTVGAGNDVTLLGGAITGGQGDGITCTTGKLTVIGTDIGGNSGSGIGDTGCGVIADRAVIHNNSIGISKQSGTLTLTRSSIETNNNGGVIVSTNGTRFTIVGNVFWQNGNQFGGVGGVALTTDTSTQSRLEFNSFNGNLVNTGLAAAVQCTVAGFVARNNVMFGNGTGEQVSGSCTHVHSISSPGTALSGAGNSAADPMFVNAATGDLHTLPGSPTENAGDPTSDLTGDAATDADGDARTAPADIGFDQHP